MASRKNEVTNNPIPKIKSQVGVRLLNNISWLIPTFVALYLGWVQFYQYVEADLTVTAVEVESNTPSQTIYAIHFVINNSGNESIVVVNAAPFVKNLDQNIPPKILLATGLPETFKDSSIDGGKVKSFSAHAYLDDTFIRDGMRDGEFLYNKTSENKPVEIPIELGVRIYGADGKFRAATSIPIKITYSKGKQIAFSVLYKSVMFEEVDTSKWTTIPFDKHVI